MEKIKKFRAWRRQAVREAVRRIAEVVMLTDQDGVTVKR
jgi:hypothetical protein